MPEKHDKTWFRNEVSRQIKAMNAEDRARKNDRILARLRDYPVYRDLKTVLFYHPMPDEIDLTPLIREHLARALTVCLPLCITGTHTISIKHILSLDDLIPGTYGIMEPKAECGDFPAADLEGVLTPGRAFDSTGRRVGRGAGYYDRLFRDTPAVKIAAAFEAQIFPEVPADSHDLPVDVIVTEERIIESRLSAGG